ncbi:type II toxin-antitoxin system RelE/ParE family toxin [Actinocatenispora comari]|uniref:type II toxin-antitoxin system RelE/ParE family toxin n=1 Tax=Actinocatenispora comari TaxID=2807577 RepID=UPI001CEC32CE|nr:type II toxin-antitoxin system RelE/ParE family toxin [Actinocatenispora comari]
MILVDEVDDWFVKLPKDDAERVAGAIDQLAEHGPMLGRPTADTITGSTLPNLKELRPGSIRILFCFDTRRQAILLVAGDKAGQWQKWYDENIPIAEQRFAKWEVGGYDEER